jgi:hypothetical protein
MRQFWPNQVNSPLIYYKYLLTALNRAKLAKRLYHSDGLEEPHNFLALA